jgi:hypothetical protein
MQNLRYFFAVWDTVEQMHPWGVERLRPLLADFGVPAAMCDEIDSRLYLDLMISHRPDVQRIRVEGRHTGVVFWVQVDEAPDDPAARVVIAFQRTPSEPFGCRVLVGARPRALMACLVGYHRVMLLGRRVLRPTSGVSSLVCRRKWPRQVQ